MQRARFRRLIDLIGEALERPEAERMNWLAAECAEDGALLEEARSLLAQASAASLTFADLTLRLEAGISRAAKHALSPPEQIGPYRILEVLGEGGMGIVYGARQLEPLRRDVALKVIRFGAHAPELVARFDAERHALAALDHPCIAHILDAGQTEEGLPYFTMEWIRGEPITRYCDARRLTLEQRLQLFRRVLAAVQHAHQKAVVHRDLKPSNVLVTEVDGEPQPKVIDFGVARVLDGEVGMSAVHTAFGAVLGTPEYMSPEQVLEPGAVDTRSDIYSLGVLLYELVTGCVPLPLATLRGTTPAEFERLLRDSDPPTPSRRVAPGTQDADRRAASRATEPRRLTRTLRGDLDNIADMALRKDPTRRYASVAQFDDDIRQYLEGRPVAAHPATVAYRLRRFAGRHRAAVLGTAAALFMMAATTALFTVRLAAERNVAQREALKATQVAAMLESIFEVSDPMESGGRTVSARELLDEGAARIESALADQPEVQAPLMRLIGQVYRSLGMTDQAYPLVYGALERHRALYGDRHEEVATSEAALAAVFTDMGRVEAAVPLFRKALATRRELFGHEHPRVGESLSYLAQALDAAGERAEAEVHYRDALEQQLRFFGAVSPEVAATRLRLGGLLRVAGRLDEAEPLLRDGLDVQLAHYGDAHVRTASAARHLAALLRDLGAYAEADSLYREVLAVRRRVLGSGHPELATTLSSHALLLQQRGDIDGAIAALTEAVSILEQNDGSPHRSIAGAYHNMGIQLRTARRPDEAEVWFLRSLAAQDRMLPEGHVDRAFPRFELARLYLEQNRPSAAEPLLREALALRRAGLPAGHRRIGDVLSELGACLTSLHRYAEAEPLLLEGHALLLAAEGAESSRTRTAARRLATLYTAWGRDALAADWRDG